MKEFKSPYMEALQKARREMKKETHKLIEEDEIFEENRMTWKKGTVILVSSQAAGSSHWI